MIEHGHATHTGLRRDHNEDTYWADAERGLWLVADGMGGPARGEVASGIAIDVAAAELAGGAAMTDAFRRAGSAVRAHATRGPAASLTGSTLAALRMTDGAHYELAWIGDSRIYVWQDGTLAHAPRGEPAAGEEAGANSNRRIRPAASTPPRNAVTQALGITPESAIDARASSGTCAPGMQFLLCSDGLSDELGDDRLAAIVARTDLAAQECVDHLILAALDAGGRDNVTAVLVRVR